MAVMRSIMYVPGNNPKMVEKAPSIPADIITLDLEDSVPPSEKEAARKLVAEKLKYAGSGGAQVYVRINNWETEMTNDDLEAVVWEGLDGVTLAKTGHPDDVKRLDWKLEELERRRGIPVGTVKISMLLETAKGIMNAYEIVTASDRMLGCAISGGDFRKSMHVQIQRDGVEMMVARGQMLLAARAAGVQCFDTMFPNIDDMDGFKAEVIQNHKMGFDGKSIVNPKQIAFVHETFAPTEKEIAYAEKLVRGCQAQADAGIGVYTVDGKMVDIPFFEDAKRIIALAKACGVYHGDL